MSNFLPGSFFDKCTEEERKKYQRIIDEGKAGKYSNPDEAIAFINIIIEFLHKESKGAFSIAVAKWLLADAERQKRDES